MLVDCLVLGSFSLICFVVGVLQLRHIGPPLNNAYFFATKKEREEMDTDPLHRQSAIVFLLLGATFLLITINAVVRKDWIFWLILILAAGTLIYALFSSAKLRKDRWKEEDPHHFH